MSFIVLVDMMEPYLNYYCIFLLFALLVQTLKQTRMRVSKWIRLLQGFFVGVMFMYFE
jgi:hypothetical protein